MSNLYGADVDQLRQLSRELAQQAEQLGSAASRVSGRVENMAWRGPDADGFRSDWKGQHAATIRAAQQQLQDASAQALANAKAQEEASGASSGGTSLPFGPSLIGTMPYTITPWAAPGFSLKDFMAETNGVVNEKIPGLPWSLTDLGGVVPGVGDALNIRSLVDDVSHGQFPIHEIVDGAAGLIQKAGPVGYWGSVAIKSWDLALTQLDKADLSQSGIDTTLNYIQSNPLDSLAAAGEAVVKFIPNIFSIFK